MREKLLRTESTHEDFVSLVRHLDAELAIKNGDNHDFFAQYNKIDTLQHVVVVYNPEGQPVSCGAIKPFDENSVEVKRMYTLTEHRGKGYAGVVLNNLEQWASELGYERCVLETSADFHEAIGLYQKKGYKPIPKYGQYIEVESSRCFQKYVL
ncbi:N-acetyltransferase (plasmid) [Fulvitalea axinellae]|uniref:N-acetyltransferase n=1 Tax=Fulvitalea axinellae TaxID=1182444 RepID=A0AAU9D420_9BACT|nr:N-acetyltransferase [Fulvitalea axinellae]